MCCAYKWNGDRNKVRNLWLNGNNIRSLRTDFIVGNWRPWAINWLARPSVRMMVPTSWTVVRLDETLHMNALGTLPDPK